MKLSLTVRVGISDDQRSDIPAFIAQRTKLLTTIADHFRSAEPYFLDNGLVFDDVSFSDRREIESYAASINQNILVLPRLEYEESDIARAAFLRLAIDGDEVDCDDDWRPFNRYSILACEACGYPDFERVPSPFVVKPLSIKKHMYSASNGIRIVSETLWQALQPVLNPWVQSGDVAFVDQPNQVQHEWRWIRPRELSGPYALAVVSRRCDVCTSPLHVYFGDAEDPLWNGMEIVTAFPPDHCPMSLVGNWYGEISPDKPTSVSWDILISGDLHARLMRMKVKGFVKSEKVVFTRAEAEALEDMAEPGTS